MNLRILAFVAAAAAFAGCSSNSNAPSAPAAPAAKVAEKEKPLAAVQAKDGKVIVHATADGFTPSKIEAVADKELTLVFIRDVEKTCMTGVVFPELGIEKDLPLHEEVVIQVMPKENGTIAFQCPMGMGKSAIVSLPRG